MAEVTEEAIVEAAKEIFVSKGYAATRMQEIADAANINKAMLHYYFRSKDALFHVVVTRTLEKVFPKFAQALEYEGTVIERIENVVNTYIEIIRSHPHVPLFILTELSQKRGDFLAEIERRVIGFPKFKSFFDQIDAEVQAGRIRAVPPMHLILNVVSMCAFPFIAQPVFCTVARMPEEQFDALMQERADAVNDFIRHALRP